MREFIVQFIWIIFRQLKRLDVKSTIIRKTLVYWWFTERLPIFIVKGCYLNIMISVTQFNELSNLAVQKKMDALSRLVEYISSCSSLYAVALLAMLAATIWFFLEYRTKKTVSWWALIRKTHVYTIFLTCIFFQRTKTVEMSLTHQMRGTKTKNSF